MFYWYAFAYFFLCFFFLFFFFFFSSRRRHTRWPRDWSSDVCSSDLTVESSCLRIQPFKSPECRHGEKGMKTGVGAQALPLIRRAREKDVGVNPCDRTKN